jgi:MOSC domain-containing protein YiiM
MTTGILLGIARHARSKAPMEVVDAVDVSREGGIAGDFRGAMKGKPYKRQVTLIERADWDAAMAEVGHSIPWQERRSNLLIDGLDLPQIGGVRLRIGAEVVLEVTRECDPCERMEALAHGLRAALTPDWRGGACAMVVYGGRIAVGDKIRIEEQWPSHSERSTTSATSTASAFSSARI